MFINPIQLNSLGDISALGQQAKERPGTGFQDVFNTAWNSAADTQQDLVEKQYLQSIGAIDDTHTVPIAASKAELSLSLLVGLRNKALDAYNELMRISV